MQLPILTLYPLLTVVINSVSLKHSFKLFTDYSALLPLLHCVDDITTVDHISNVLSVNVHVQIRRGEREFIKMRVSLQKALIDFRLVYRARPIFHVKVQPEAITPFINIHSRLTNQIN